jgi:DNA-binding NtrC family response regulator
MTSFAGVQDVVLVINTSPDVVDILKDVLERAGFLVVTAFTWAIQNASVDLEALRRTHRPKVVVYDIAPPYERNWAFFLHLKQHVLQDVRFVLTSMNVAHVEGLVGRDERVYEVVGKPHDLDMIVRATKEAARARPTR